MAVYIGNDFHPHQQTICYMDSADGEIHRCELKHDYSLVREFYSQFKGEVVIGLEAGNPCRWFEMMMSELGHQVLFGDAKEIRLLARSRHKSDPRDAQHLLDLLLRSEFPVLWRRSEQSQAILGQLRFRHALVQQRTRIYNHLQALAHTAGLPKRSMKSVLTRDQLKKADLSQTQIDQRDHWFSMLKDTDSRIKQLDQWVVKTAADDPVVSQLGTQPGVGALTALCVTHTLGDVSRFRTSRQVTAYAGLDPVEKSSGSRRHIGRISKAGSPLLRFLLLQAGQAAIKRDLQLRQFYKQLCHRRGHAIAKVALARKVLVRSYIMLRDKIDYAQYRRHGVAVGQSDVSR
jgi:transposase